MDKNVNPNDKNFYVYQARKLMEINIFTLPLFHYFNKTCTNNSYFYNFAFTSKHNPQPIHASELQYVFGNGIRDREDLECGEFIKNLWVEFIIKGNPNSKSNQLWKRFDKQKSECLYIDMKSNNMRKVKNLVEYENIIKGALEKF